MSRADCRWVVGQPAGFPADRPSWMTEWRRPSLILFAPFSALHCEVTGSNQAEARPPSFHYCCSNIGTLLCMQPPYLLLLNFLLLYSSLYVVCSIPPGCPYVISPQFVFQSYQLLSFLISFLFAMAGADTSHLRFRGAPYMPSWKSKPPVRP